MIDVSLSDEAARATLACLYDRRAALADHVSRADTRNLSEGELEMCYERLRELDEAIEKIETAKIEAARS